MLSLSLQYSIHGGDRFSYNVIYENEISHSVSHLFVEYILPQIGTVRQEVNLSSDIDIEIEMIRRFKEPSSYVTNYHNRIRGADPNTLNIPRVIDMINAGEQW